MKGYFLPEEIMGMLLNYLVQKPYFEVTKLIAQLQSLSVVDTSALPKHDDVA
jgi:hypothetical protein